MNRKRLFLPLLVLFLLLITMANQHVQNTAALMGNARVLGSIPLWQLYNVLPAGIFAAGVSAVALGMGAEFWRALLPLCGAGWAPRGPLSRLADTGLWCGWVTLAACITALANVFPWSVGAPGAYGPGLSETTFFDIEHYRLVLQIGGGCMILCRILALKLRERAALPIAVLVAGLALVCGQFWCRAQPISYFSLTLLLPWAVLLVWRPVNLCPQQFYMTVAAMAIALYGIGFSSTIGPYVIDSADLHDNTAENALLLLGVLLLSLTLRPVVLRSAWMQRTVGLLLLFCSLYPIWELVASGAAGEQTADFRALSAGCYMVPLLCISGLVAMRLWVTAPEKSHEINEN
ncbi:MAG: hypothetical protein IJ943_01760 [Akkermansia sp.]|nr:hypothetical protein [Akkermansia sp.]